MNLGSILDLAYFLLPAAIANMIPVFVKHKFDYLNLPLDFGIKLGGKRLLGENKTLRGLIFAIIGAIITVYLQIILYDYKLFRNLSIVDYSQINFLLFGFLTGFGVMFGDAIGSFVKRRLNVAPGKPLLFVDQVNSVVGLGIFVLPFYLRSFKDFVYLLIIWTVGHFVLKFLGYLFKVDREAI